MTLTCDQRTSILRAHMSRMTSDRFPVFFPGIEQPHFQGLYSSLPWSAPKEGRRETLETRLGIEVLAARFHEGRTRRKGQSFMTEKLVHEETQWETQR